MQNIEAIVNFYIIKSPQKCPLVFFIKSKKFTGCDTEFCQIDLGVEAKFDEKYGIGDPYVIGSSATITIIFLVTNFGSDPAYLPELKIPLNGERFSKLPEYCKIQVRIIYMFFFFLDELRKFTISDFPKQMHLEYILITLFFSYTL